MTDKEKKHIENFLNTHYGKLHMFETNGQYKVLGHQNKKTTIFLIEEKNDQIFVDSKKVIDPILKIFATDYSETYDFVKEWILKKYGLDCIDLVGMK
jgi:hypothetical protein